MATISRYTSSRSIIGASCAPRRTLAPSILAASFARLGAQVTEAEKAGIDPATAQLAVKAGANVLVAGSAVFGDVKGVRTNNFKEKE